ncbi:hypothetical protein L208DRAFT_1099814, partial [Tricholoma matsutake]
EEHQQAENAEHLANIEKAKHQVIIYAWPKDGAEAIVFEVQGGFTWPLFTLTSATFSEAGLLLPGPVEETHVKKYNTWVHTWLLVPVGHVIMLKPGDHIFLKGWDVTNCHDFKTLLSGSQDCKPHFCNNLPQKRTHVRKALKER